MECCLPSKPFTLAYHLVGLRFGTSDLRVVNDYPHTRLCHNSYHIFRCRVLVTQCQVTFVAMCWPYHV